MHAEVRRMEYTVDREERIVMELIKKLNHQRETKQGPVVTAKSYDNSNLLVW